MFDVNLTGSGNITTTYPLQALPFNNPGSVLSSVPVANRPVYNNIMGTFSLLQTPTIKYTNMTMEDCQTYPDPDYGSYTNCYYDVAWQLENLSDIKWVLNPESQLSVDQLVASYVFSSQNTTYESEHFPLGCFNAYKPVINLGTNTYIPDIQTIYLKIVGTFNAPNNQKLVFTSRYNVNLQRIYAAGYTGGTSELPPSNCSSITPPASPSEIAAVCNSSQYTSRRDQFFKATPTDTYVKGNPKSNADIEMLISPNPASNSLNLQYSIKNEGKVKIAIYDLSGKMVKSLAMYNDAKEGAYALQADLSDVANGMYFVVLDLNGKTVTQKLSVMKK